MLLFENIAWQPQTIYNTPKLDILYIYENKNEMKKKMSFTVKYKFRSKLRIREIRV